MTAVAEIGTISRDEQLAEALSKVQQLAQATVDAVIPQAGLRMAATEPERREHGADPVHLIANQGEGQEVRVGVLDGGHDQIADKLDIDRKYYRKMLAQEPQLLAANVNRWLFREQGEKRLLRMLRPVALGPERAKGIEALGAPFALRAYLSNGYKMIDHYSVLRVLAPEMEAHQARTESFHLSEQRFHVRVVSPAIDVMAGRARQRGEMVAFGVSVRNSETGHGSAAVELFASILRCTNGMVVDEALRIAHVGRKQEPSEGWVSDDARRLADAADILKIRDRIRYGFSLEAQDKVASQIAKAIGEPLQLSAGQSVLEFVTNVGQRYDLTKAESEALKDTVMEELAQSNTKPSEATRWSVAQAFTALGRNVGVGNGEPGNFERKVELERIGWKIIADPMDALLKAGKAASN